jgi:hypothetical protein
VVVDPLFERVVVDPLFERVVVDPLFERVVVDPLFERAISGYGLSFASSFSPGGVMGSGPGL